MPFFNAEKTLERAIVSVLEQSFSDFELILINNNSSDGSVAVAEKFLHKDNRITLLQEKTQGVVFASNKGMQGVRTEYIARTDADDILLPEKLKKQVEFLYQNPQIDVVATQVEYVGSSGNEGFKKFVDFSNEIITHQQISLNRFVELPVVNPTIMFRREIAQKNGLYRNGNFPEDYEMFLRWIENGVKFQKIPERLLAWHDSKTRLTRTDQRYSFEAFYETKTPFLANYLQKNNPNHPKVVVWGAGKLSQKRAKILEKYGIEIDFYIDVDTKKTNQTQVLHYSQIDSYKDSFVLSYVANRGARAKIRSFLTENGFIEGKNFLIVA